MEGHYRGCKRKHGQAPVKRGQAAVPTPGRGVGRARTFPPGTQIQVQAVQGRFHASIGKTENELKKWEKDDRRFKNVVRFPHFAVRLASPLGARARRPRWVAWVAALAATVGPLHALFATISCILCGRCACVAQMKAESPRRNCNSDGGHKATRWARWEEDGKYIFKRRSA